MASLDDPFDLVLASDCLYDPAMFSAFRRALVAFCSPRTVLLMTYKRRLDRCDKKKNRLDGRIDHQHVMSVF